MARLVDKTVATVTDGLKTRSSLLGLRWPGPAAECDVIHDFEDIIVHSY